MQGSPVPTSVEDDRLKAIPYKSTVWNEGWKFFGERERDPH